MKMMLVLVEAADIGEGCRGGVKRTHVALCSTDVRFK